MIDAPFVKIFDQYSEGLSLGSQYILVVMFSETQKLYCWFVYDHNSELVLNGEMHNPVDAFERAKDELSLYDREKCVATYQHYLEKRNG